MASTGPTTWATSRKSARETATWDTLATVGTSFAARSTGVTQLVTVSAAPIVCIHPHPNPKTAVRASNVTPAITVAFARHRHRRHPGICCLWRRPGDRKYPHETWELDRPGQGTKDNAPREVTPTSDGESGYQEADHEGVVMAGSNKKEQDQRVQDPQGERHRGIFSVAASQGRYENSDQSDTRDRQETQGKNREQSSVTGELDNAPFETAEEWAVGGRNVDPEPLSQRREGCCAENAGTVQIGAYMVADHFPLCRVAVDVIAEHGRSHQQGHQPHHEDFCQMPRILPRLSNNFTGYHEPGAAQQDNPGESAPELDKECERARLGHAAPLARGWRSEEPSPGRLESERRARKGRRYAEKCRPEQPRPGRSAVSAEGACFTFWVQTPSRRSHIVPVPMANWVTR